MTPTCLRDTLLHVKFTISISLKGICIIESKSWAVDPKTGVKKALTSNGEWFDTFEFGSKNGIATQSGDEDDTFAADAPLADAAFGK
jgi:hypothetical protein